MSKSKKNKTISAKATIHNIANTYPRAMNKSVKRSKKNGKEKKK